MPPRVPVPVPELPVTSIERAAAYYVTHLGFTLDWGNETGGIAGLSQDDCRIFLTNTAFHQHYGTRGPVVIWLNLSSRHEVDALYHRWHQSGAQIPAPPDDKPWNLREFTAVDPDGNQLRVFYDFSGDL